VEKTEHEQNQQLFLLPYGWKLYLQSAAKNNKWLDWIYLAKLTFANASISVFAAKNFQKGGIIGFYVGEETWKAPTPGTEEPSKEYMKSQKIKEDLYCLLTRNSDATIPQLHPKLFEDGSSQPLYMGIHYLNNACLIYVKDSTA
jgi:hypothetical protein